MGRKVILSLLVGYLVLLGSDKSIAVLIDRKLRKDGIVPNEFLAAFPGELPENWIAPHCKTYTAYRFWRYKLCLVPAKKYPPCTESPVFSLKYWAPTVNLVPFWEDFYFGTPIGERLDILTSHKVTCGALLEKEYTDE